MDIREFISGPMRGKTVQRLTSWTNNPKLARVYQKTMKETGISASVAKMTIKQSDVAMIMQGSGIKNVVGSEVLIADYHLKKARVKIFKPELWAKTLPKRFY